MIVNYIGSMDNRHEVSEYILSTGTKLVLSFEEVEEFLFNVYMLEITEDYKDDKENDNINTYNKPINIKEPNE